MDPNHLIPVEKSSTSRILRAAWLSICLLAACTPERSGTHEITGTQAQRVAAVSGILRKNGPLPSALLDAHFLEQQTGDGQLGPSDFNTFYALTVSTTDLGAWRSALSPAPTAPEFVAPSDPHSWWLAKQEFPTLTFYSPEPLTGRPNGWVGIAPDGRILIFNFTM